LAQKYFTRFPARQKASRPDVVTLEVEQLAEKADVRRAEANPQVTSRGIQFVRPPGHLRAQYLSQILSTRTGRLYKGWCLAASGY